MFNDETEEVVEETAEEETAEEETVEGTETTDPEETEEVEETTDWKAEALKYKAILDRIKKKGDTAPKTKSNDFGYDVKAYLKASGITENEFDFVKAQMKESGLKDVDSLLGNSYFKARLEEHRELEKTKDSAPKSRRSGGVATNSAEYWASKPIEEVPMDMRREVVNFKLKKDQNKGKFYNQ